MFLFLKLVLAHLIADFILQFEELYQLKVRSFIGQLIHILIHGAVTALLLFPYLKEPWVLIYIVLLMAEHLLQDVIKYHFTKKVPQKAFVFYMADQFFHFLALSAVFLFPFAHETRGLSGHPFWDTFYNDNLFTLFLIFLITLTFAANYTLNAFYKSYVKGARPMHWITSPEMAWAIIERGVIASAFLFPLNRYWVFPALLIGLLRLPFPKLRSLTEFLISAVYTVLLSWGFLCAV
jgi:hypothetical protein